MALKEIKTPVALERAQQIQSEGSLRKRTLTGRGQDFVESLKIKNMKQAAKALENKINKVELKWIDEGSDFLRNSRHDLEKTHGLLEKQYSERSWDQTKHENSSLLQHCDKVNQQALELRKKIGERIFELEKEESRTRRSSETSSKCGTQRSISTHKSLREMKLRLARSKVDFKFSSRQAELELELQRKRFESEQLEKLRLYESAKAEKDALEEFEYQTVLSEEIVNQIEAQSELERLYQYFMSINTSDASQDNIEHNITYESNLIDNVYHNAAPSDLPDRNTHTGSNASSVSRDQSSTEGERDNVTYRKSAM